MAVMVAVGRVMLLSALRARLPRHRLGDDGHSVHGPPSCRSFPLSFANSCLATADAARVYFGERPRLCALAGWRRASARQTCSPARSAECRSATAPAAPHMWPSEHEPAEPARDGNRVARARARLRRRTRGAPDRLSAPDPAALLATAGLLHISLLRDLREPWAWALALAVGLVGFQVHLALALGGEAHRLLGPAAGGALARARPRTA